MPQKIFIHFLCGSWTPPLLDLSPVDAEGRLRLSSSQQPLCTKRLLPSPPPVYFSWDHTKLIPSLFPPRSCFFRPLVAFLWTFSNLSTYVSNYSCIHAEEKIVFLQVSLCDTAFYTPHTTFAFFMTQICNLILFSSTADLWSILSKCGTLHFHRGNSSCVFSRPFHWFPKGTLNSNAILQCTCSSSQQYHVLIYLAHLLSHRPDSDSTGQNWL